MEEGNFYFIKKQYFLDFPDKYLMGNNNRPCFFAFIDPSTNLYWLIPFTSKVVKFKKICQNKIQRNGICDTIVFGDILGHEKAFLIQNMFPITDKYIENVYIDKATGNNVKIDGALEQDIIGKAKKVLSLQRYGNKLIFPDVLHIEDELLKTT